MMLYKLLSKLNPEIFSSAVISLTDEGLFGAKIEELGGENVIALVPP